MFAFVIELSAQLSHTISIINSICSAPPTLSHITFLHTPICMKIVGKIVHGVAYEIDVDYKKWFEFFFRRRRRVDYYM